MIKNFFDRISKKREEKEKREANYVSRADLELSMGNMLEAVHEGQKSTERLLEVINANVNSLGGRVDTMSKRIDGLQDQRGV